MPVRSPRSRESAKPRPRIDLDRDRLVTRRELSRLSGLDPKTLRIMDMERRGPRYLKLGTSKQARVVYRLSDCEAWIASRATEFGPLSRE